jgi:hypothetical protein
MGRKLALAPDSSEPTQRAATDATSPANAPRGGQPKEKRLGLVDQPDKLGRPTFEWKVCAHSSTLLRGPMSAMGRKQTVERDLQ